MKIWFFFLSPWWHCCPKRSRTVTLENKRGRALFSFSRLTRAVRRKSKQRQQTVWQHVKQLNCIIQPWNRIDLNDLKAKTHLWIMYKPAWKWEAAVGGSFNKDNHFLLPPWTFRAGRQMWFQGCNYLHPTDNKLDVGCVLPLIRLIITIMVVFVLLTIYSGTISSLEEAFTLKALAFWRPNGSHVFLLLFMQVLKLFVSETKISLTKSVVVFH